MADLAFPELVKLWSLARQINSSLRCPSTATMGEPQPLDAQSTKLVLIALLRAVSRMKGVLEEPDRAVLKDMVVDEPLAPALLRIGIRMAILDNDPRSGSPEDDQVHLAKRRDLLKEMWDLCKREESSDGEYEDDYESEDDEDMMMPDDDAVRDEQADSTAERDEEAQRQAQVREIAATVAKQKELLAQKMRLVEDQLSRLTALKSEAEARMRQAQQEAEDEDDGDDEETDEEEGSVEEESWDEDSDEWDDGDFQDFDLDRDADA